MIGELRFCAAICDGGAHATAPNRKKVAIQTDFLFSGSRSGLVDQIRRETHNAISLFVLYFAFFGPILL